MRAFLLSAAIFLGFVSTETRAWFFFFPLPNVSQPPELRQLIDALEKSSETRALAFVSENKVFGAKQWVWGHHAGLMSQEEANNAALAACERTLAVAKARTAGGQPLYDFGSKKCELWAFTPNDGPRIAEERRRAAEAEAARQRSIEEEAQRIVAQRSATASPRTEIAAEVVAAPAQALPEMTAAQSKLPQCPKGTPDYLWTGCFGEKVYSPTLRYVGEFRDGKHHGMGTYIRPMERYHGEFREGVRHGRGAEYTSTGNLIRSGVWRDAVFVGAD